MMPALKLYQRRCVRVKPMARWEIREFPSLTASHLDIDEQTHFQVISVSVCVCSVKRLFITEKMLTDALQLYFIIISPIVSYCLMSCCLVSLSCLILSHVGREKNENRMNEWVEEDEDGGVE